MDGDFTFDRPRFADAKAVAEAHTLLERALVSSVLNAALPISHCPARGRRGVGDSGCFTASRGAK